MKHKFFLKLVFTILLSGYFSVSYGATPIYLSSGGSDSNDGLTALTAKATLSAVMSLVDAGGTIIVSGMVDCTASGSGFTAPTGLAIAKNVTIQGTSNATDGFDGKNLTRFFSNTTYTLTLKNLKLKSGYSGTNNGGAILNSSTGTLNCENVIFDGNKTAMAASAKTGGAIQFDNTTGSTFKNCFFSNNEASKTGAIYINDWVASSTIKFEGCAFVGNIARESFGGSAIFIRTGNTNTSLYLINCTIKGNQVLSSSSTGGAVNLGAKSTQSTNVNIINCTISENTTAGTADKGAGVYVLNSVNNGTSGTNNFIGNLYIKNSIIENNTAASSTYSDIALNSTSPTVCCTGLNGATGTPGIPGYVKVENSIIGKSGATSSRIPAGNINSSSYDQQSWSTLYAKLGTYNTTLNYYPLQSSSPAIDYGASSFLSSLSPAVSTDQQGNTRPFTNGKCHAGAVEVVEAAVAQTPPALTADADANTVDNNIDITYPSNPTWQAAITSVKVGSTALTVTTDYVKTDGNIQLKPSGLNALLTVAGTKSITVVATGYNDATVSQAILAGVATKLSMKRQPVAPASNGANLATQPQLYFQDQYSNNTTSADNVTASVGAGSWTIGGTIIKPMEVAGYVSYVSLSATSTSAITGATITFSSGSLTPVTSGTFNIPAPPVVSSAVNASTLGLNANSVVTVNSGGNLTIDQGTAVNSITVAPGAKITVTGTNALTATNGITLQSNSGGTATLVDNYTDPTITATVEQYLPQGRNWYVASPIETNIATTGSLIGSGAATSVSYYSEQNGWQNDYVGNLAEGVGYVAISSSNSGTNNVTFTGKLNSGDVPVTLTRKSSGSYAGFNLIANPYPSYVNPMPAINENANLVGTIWYRTRKIVSPYEYKFETVNTTSGVGTNAAGTGMVTGYIPPMQSFWVRTNVDNQPFTFTNSMRDHARDVSVLGLPVPTTPLKAPKLEMQSIARIKVAGSTGSDEAVLYFNTDALNAYDKYDSPKMFESATVLSPEIYTTAGNEKLVINGLNAIQYDVEIPLGFIAKETGDYSISRSEMTNFEIGTRIILKDKLQPNNETELSEGIVYNFNSQATSGIDRFSLIFRAAGATTGVNNMSNLHAQVFVNAANQITIIAPEKAVFSIYNAVGQKQVENTLSSTKMIINTAFDAGVYFVSLSLNGQRKIQKVIIR